MKNKILSVVIILFCASIFNSNKVLGQIIYTYAGIGTPGYAGDNFQARQAKLNGPTGIAIDTVGNVYIAEYNNSTIRKVDSNGVITTYIGNGIPGYFGDGGPASNAQLYNPVQLNFDRKGNLYIADRFNDCIRKVSTSGIISTVAGIGGLSGYSCDNCMATNSTLFDPTGVAVDTFGNIYIADCFNDRIRKVDTSGVITTVAGDGIAGYGGDGGPAINANLYNPLRVLIDNSGNLYVSESGNNVVRIINPAGIINTFAGTSVPGFGGDGGQATNAELQDPTGLAVDEAGNIYVGDQLNNRVREISKVGIITTIVGNGVTGYGGDCGPAIDAELNQCNDIAFTIHGNMLVCDDGGNRVRGLTHIVNGGLTGNPENDTARVYSTVNYIISDTGTKNEYQWQMDSAGTGYVNLVNAGYFSGVNTPTLTITSIRASYNDCYFRCILFPQYGCLDTSSSAILVIPNLGISFIENQSNIIIVPNPTNDKFHITGINNCRAMVYNSMGQLVIDSENGTDFSLGEMPGGIYFVKIFNLEGELKSIHKLLKE